MLKPGIADTRNIANNLAHDLDHNLTQNMAHNQMNILTSQVARIFFLSRSKSRRFLSPLQIPTPLQWKGKICRSLFYSLNFYFQET
jgi:hypothetical protein